MKGSFRQSMTWLHTWSGLLLGWVLFAIFVTGTATYFRWEIQRWMQPELSAAPAPAVAASAAVRHLETHAASAPRWLVTLPDTRNPTLMVYWNDPALGRRFQNAMLDPWTGETLAARGTHGGEFFYRFHFQLMLPHPWGRYLAGVAAMFLFVALLSGIVTHRRFFADCFLLRRGGPSLRSWRDFHNVTAVLALPFYLLISYSALVIFMAMYLPWGRQVLERGEARPAVTRPATPAPTIAPVPAVPAGTDFAPLLAAVSQHWGADAHGLKRIDFDGRGTAQAKVTFTRATDTQISLHPREQLEFDGRTGALLPSPVVAGGPATTVHGYLYGLHLAHFAGPALRWAFFLMGLLGCALVATGLVMWTLKRRAAALAAGRVPFGHRLVERLNITTLAGLPLAIAALFWANRLLPLGLAGRADREVLVFLLTWGAALVHPWLRPAAAAWREQLWVGAGLYALLPALDFATTSAAHLAAWRRGDPTLLAFDAAMLACAALCWAAARRLGAQATARAGAPGVGAATPDEKPALA